MQQHRVPVGDRQHNAPLGHNAALGMSQQQQQQEQYHAWPNEQTFPITQDSIGEIIFLDNPE